ncbi:MAG: Nif3-like dinuclear metal center hexameric protein [Saprospiraceae bacterium]|nr:Nif3-like dinuclear metal center hexameric protein [Saprospiraceae bacterium]
MRVDQCTLSMFGLLLFSWVHLGAQEGLTAREVTNRIKQHVTCSWSTNTVDTYKTGSESSRVTGIATTFIANMEVIKKAHAAGLNMIITHEPTFWNHFDEHSAYKELKVFQEKRAYLERHNIVVWRFHDHWHKTNPDGIYHAFIEKMQWQSHRMEKDYVVIPQVKFKDLADRLATKFKAKAVRIVGNPDMLVSQIALSLGAASHLGHLERLDRDDVEVLIIGECREWETVEYIRDALALGKKKALIMLGHEVSEEVGMQYCADWIKEFISEIPVRHVSAEEPFIHIGTQ